MSTNAIIIIAACPNESEAKKIAHALIEHRLAACVQLSSIHSIYRWKDKLEESPEVRLLIKTTDDRFEKVTQLFRSITAYTCPEILSYRVEQGTEDYLAWIASETR